MKRAALALSCIKYYILCIKNIYDMCIVISLWDTNSLTFGECIRPVFFFTLITIFSIIIIIIIQQAGYIIYSINYKYIL